jgi:hypothetical protein
VRKVSESMHRSLGSSNDRRHSHTHSASRAPSLSARLTATIIFALLGAPVLPLLLGSNRGDLSTAAADEPASGHPRGTPPAPPAERDAAQDDAAATARLHVLIDSLADPSYGVREHSTRELLAAGERALPELRRRLDSEDSELRRRARSIIDEIARRAAQPDHAADPGLGRRLLDLPELADPAFEEAVRRLDEMLRRFDRSLSPTHSSRPDPFFDGEEWSEIERQISDLREAWRRRLPSLSGFDPLEHFGGGEGTSSPEDGFGTGRSRVQIWRDGEKVVDSSREIHFAEAPVLGVVVESLHSSLRAHLPVPEGQGVLVAEIVPGSRAESAGLHLHDILLTAGGVPIADAISLRNLLGESAGQRIELGFLRGGSPSRIDIDLTGTAK